MHAAASILRLDHLANSMGIDRYAVLLGTSPRRLNSFAASRAAQSTLEAFPRISPSFCLWFVHMMCLNLQHRDHH